MVSRFLFDLMMLVPDLIVVMSSKGDQPTGAPNFQISEENDLETAAVKNISSWINLLTDFKVKMKEIDTSPSKYVDFTLDRDWASIKSGPFLPTKLIC